jgi:hypothetical protein
VPGGLAIDKAALVVDVVAVLGKLRTAMGPWRMMGTGDESMLDPGFELAMIRR